MAILWALPFSQFLMPLNLPIQPTHHQLVYMGTVLKAL